MATKTRFQVLGEEEVPEGTSTLPQPTPPQKISTSEVESKAYVSAIEFIQLLLSVLSQRTILAISHLLPIIALASGFVLWLSVLPDPSVHQLIGVGLYGVFMLALLIVRR